MWVRFDCLFPLASPTLPCPPTLPSIVLVIVFCNVGEVQNWRLFLATIVQNTPIIQVTPPTSPLQDHFIVESLSYHSPNHWCLTHWLNHWHCIHWSNHWHSTHWKKQWKCRGEVGYVAWIYNQLCTIMALNHVQYRTSPALPYTMPKRNDQIQCS